MSRAVLPLTLVCLGLAACSEYQLHAVNVHPDEVTECPFVPTAIDELYRYDCNPVFTTTGEDWAETLSFSTFGHTEVAGHPFYQLWYAGSPSEGGDFDMGYAISDSGTEWTPHPDNPGWPSRSNSDWDGGKVQALEVAWDVNMDGYVMLYGGIDEDKSFFGAGLAASHDGLNWELSPNNPVIDFGLTYEGVDYAWPLALNIGASNYDAYLGGSVEEGSINVYRLSTDDPENWAVDASRVFKAGSDGEWDDEGFVDISIVELDDHDYMFYVGFGEWIDQGNVRSVSDSYVGLASKGPGDDAWNRQHGGFLPLNTTLDGDAQMVAARAIGPRIHLWVLDYYTELNQRAIGYFLYCPDPADCEQGGGEEDEEDEEDS